MQSLSDLGGKKVCAAKGSTSIRAIAADGAQPVPVAVDDWTDCLVMLQQNQVAAISTDNTILAGLARQDPNTKVVGPRFTSEPYGIAVNRDARPGPVRQRRTRQDPLRRHLGRLYARWLTVLGPAPHRRPPGTGTDHGRRPLPRRTRPSVSSPR